MLHATIILVICIGGRAFIMHLLIVRLVVGVFFALCHAALQATRISGIQTVNSFLLVIFISRSAGTVPT